MARFLRELRILFFFRAGSVNIVVFRVDFLSASRKRAAKNREVWCRPCCVPRVVSSSRRRRSAVPRPCARSRRTSLAAAPASLCRRPSAGSHPRSWRLCSRCPAHRRRRRRPRHLPNTTKSHRMTHDPHILLLLLLLLY